LPQRRVVSVNLRNILLSRDLSRDVTATIVGVPPEAVANWLEAAVCPDPEHIDRLARVLGVLPEMFYEDMRPDEGCWGHALAVLNEAGFRFVQCPESARKRFSNAG
jgi:hypothetical protein